jgi:uncharacterized protein (DUF305 family)
MQRKTWAALSVLLALVAAGLIAGCGSEEETTTQSQAEAPGNPTDRAFAAEMVPHHRSAVEMATIAESEGTSRFVKLLAADIIRTQNAEIDQLRRVDKTLAEAGVEKGELGMGHQMSSMEDAEMLRGAKPFDKKFIEMMVPHHEDAIDMAQVELDKGANPEFKRLAQDIINAQQREINQMQAHLGGGAGTGDDAGDNHSGK